MSEFSFEDAGECLSEITTPEKVSSLINSKFDLQKIVKKYGTNPGFVAYILSVYTTEIMNGRAFIGQKEVAEKVLLNEVIKGNDINFEHVKKLVKMSCEILIDLELIRKTGREKANYGKFSYGFGVKHSLYNSSSVNVETEELNKSQDNVSLEQRISLLEKRIEQLEKQLEIRNG